MKIAVIGTGGVGGYFGGLLARNGADVTFVARGVQYSTLLNHGLTVKSVEGEFHLPAVHVVDSAAKLQNPDLILIATKTYDRDEVARQLIEVVDRSTIVISIQNGIDNDIRLKEILPNTGVFPGLAYIVSARTAPGLIEQTAGPRTVVFGDRSNPHNSKLKEIETVMQSAGILATYAADIDRELWTKFLWITTFAGMTAMCRCEIGRIVNDPDAFALYVECLDEAVLVAQTLGINLGDQTRDSIIKKSEHYRHTGSHAKSSMLIDIENGRPTEIEALNGALVRLAEVCGVRTPINRAIYNAVRLGSHK